MQYIIQLKGACALLQEVKDEGTGLLHLFPFTPRLAFFLFGVLILQDILTYEEKKCRDKPDNPL